MSNHFALPVELIDLISSGSWQQISAEQVGRAIWFLPRGTQIRLVHDLDELVIVRDSRRSMYEELGIGTSDPDDPRELDLSRAIFIGFGSRDGDDAWLALDYRLSFDSPRVVCSRIADGICKFEEVASDFKTFAALVLHKDGRSHP